MSGQASSTLITPDETAHGPDADKQNITLQTKIWGSGEINRSRYGRIGRSQITRYHRDIKLRIASPRRSQAEGDERLRALSQKLGIDPAVWLWGRWGFGTGRYKQLRHQYSNSNRHALLWLILTPKVLSVAPPACKFVSHTYNTLPTVSGRPLPAWTLWRCGKLSTYFQSTTKIKLTSTSNF